MLYDGGAKGGTVFIDGSRDSQVLTLTNEDNDLDDQEISTEEASSQDLSKTSSEDEGPENTNGKAHKEHLQDLEIGIEAGNLCPVCQEGEVILLGGCTECSNGACGAQLKCD